MSKTSLTKKSRAEFVLSMGTASKQFVDECNQYSMLLSDKAESERSEPLRLRLWSLAGQVDKLVEEVLGTLGTDRA